MAKKTINWKTKGMSRDSSVSAFSAEFAYENHNLRLATNEGNTMMSWVNERGTKKLSVKINTTPWLDKSISSYEYEVKGAPLGTAVINHKLVIFTTNDGDIGSSDITTQVDRIYVLQKSSSEYDFEGKLLYKGNLGFSINYPIETLISYESEAIQKIYWTDNHNQVRFINVASSMDSKTIKYNDNTFDFVPTVGLNEYINVYRTWGVGEFAPGVIQYAFTYYNKYGQESNIFYTTPLWYITHLDRAGKADDKIANAFNISIQQPDTNFDYVRIYSIQRTSRDATPITKRLVDLSLEDGIEYGTVRYSYDDTDYESSYKISWQDPGGCKVWYGKDTLNYDMLSAISTDEEGNYIIDTSKYWKFSTNSREVTWNKSKGSIILGDSDGQKKYWYFWKEEGDIPFALVNKKSDFTVYFIDTGLIGETVDPTELLYLGGEVVVTKTMEQKDNTLFLGNLVTKTPGLSNLRKTILSKNEVTDTNYLANTNVKSTLDRRQFYQGSKSPFVFLNTLSGKASCFKSWEYYRLGVQFQYYTGKWSEPCWIGDKQCSSTPSCKEESNGYLSLPIFTYTLDKEILSAAYKLGYRRVRPLFVVPNDSDRTIFCQGIGAPTMYRKVDRDRNLYGISSWLFRTPVKSNTDWKLSKGGMVSYKGTLQSHFTDPISNTSVYNAIKSPYLSSTEVMGIYDDDHAYKIDADTLITVHSPDVDLDDFAPNVNLSSYKLYIVGSTTFTNTYGDMSIQTSSTTIGSDAAGYEQKGISTQGYGALISGLYYNDYIVDDLGDSKYEAYKTDYKPLNFPVFMWHRNGALNNDVTRDNTSAKLLKKRIGNFRLGGTTTYTSEEDRIIDLKAIDIKLFDSDEQIIIKVNGKVYEGNVDTMVIPSTTSPFYIAGDPASNNERDSTETNYRIWLDDPDNTNSESGYRQLKWDNVWKWEKYVKTNNDIGDKTKGVANWRDGVPIKFKSTPHLVAYCNNTVGNNTLYKDSDNSEISAGSVPIIEVRKEYNASTIFGGASDEVLQEATWIPCGEPVTFKEDGTGDGVVFARGDCYFQRYECLKTYPYTTDDKNQVVEIASFMVESRVNADGRYDRNRGTITGFTVRPTNFNLMNPVYSQMDNFFSYKILADNSSESSAYPNNITWTKTKQNGADVDLWTNITMASTLELDGDKGEITKLARFNDQLLSFQDRGIAQILYNEQTQISSTEGVPIEIANSGKVQGKRYSSDTVGCSNKWSIVTTPSGIYFMDSNEKSIYLFNGQLNNISTSGGFNTWTKQNIPSADVDWNTDFKNFVSYYDRLNQEVLFINKDTALAYSEKFNCFTSFYDYGDTPYLIGVDDTEIWLKDTVTFEDSESKCVLWQHQAGDYCKFFDSEKPYYTILIGNQEPQLDKIFTNLEFRACVDGEGTYDEDKDKFTPSLPFNSLEVWNEYQHGMLSLTNRNSKVIHGNSSGDLIRKFRIWRCDIPRDNATIDTTTESKMGIKRFVAHPLDRMRNPWIYLKLSKESGTTNKTEIHDIVATYFG